MNFSTYLVIPRLNNIILPLYAMSPTSKRTHTKWKQSSWEALLISSQECSKLELICSHCEISFGGRVRQRTHVIDISLFKKYLSRFHTFKNFFHVKETIAYCLKVSHSPRKYEFLNLQMNMLLLWFRVFSFMRSKSCFHVDALVPNYWNLIIHQSEVWISPIPLKSLLSLKPITMWRAPFTNSLESILALQLEGCRHLCDHFARVSIRTLSCPFTSVFMLFHFCRNLYPQTDPHENVYLVSLPQMFFSLFMVYG